MGNCSFQHLKKSPGVEGSVCSCTMHIHLWLVTHFSGSDLHREVMIQGLVLSKKGYLIRKQTRRQIFSILALCLKFFIASRWCLGVFSLSWYEKDQGWMNLNEFVKPACHGLCGLSAHGSPQAPFGLRSLGFLTLWVTSCTGAEGQGHSRAPLEAPGLLWSTWAVRARGQLCCSVTSWLLLI